MTVAQNVAFGLRMEKLSKADVAAAPASTSSSSGWAASPTACRPQMSGGQQQRVALARALAKRPAVLLLDEPLGALDLKLRKQMQTELARIHRQVGTTFVFVTHDQEEALSMATQIAIMSNGKVLQQGSPREVYDRPANRFVADFVGDTNFLEGTVRRDDGRAVFDCRRRHVVDVPGDADAGPATLMIRPEFLALPPGRRDGRRRAGLPGTRRQRRLPRQSHADHGRHGGRRDGRGETAWNPGFDRRQAARIG